MAHPEKPSPHPLRKIFLTVEFSSLAILLASMAWLSRQTTDTESINPAWLLIPALASLGVFLSFIGLMYLRWVVSADDSSRSGHKIIFSLLAVTLLGVWVYGIANTWFSLNAQ